MTRARAEAMARVVRAATDDVVEVSPDGDAYVVDVHASTGRWTLYDELDWTAWQDQIVGPGESAD